MRDAQEAMLTEAEEKNLRDWLDHVARLTIPAISVTVERRILILVLTALADARLEVARLTEERDTEQAQVDLLMEAVESSLWNLGQCPSGDHCNHVTRIHDRLQTIHENLLTAARKRQAERDQQREDIRRLVEALRGWHHPHPASCSLCLLLAEMKERYDA